ncbi:hypothetical protein [Maritalea porphyrae]|uniref:hypothetical protein n=1 Tax=Maritalea porphyrae TaxID=880732 RepID=UPI0022B07C60|nr:hypothetical protein [Maritalea porphyrae]MCZ4270937.1 hypothetical protein [Maritalea porphyrae]
MKRDKYEEFKNFLHNELGISKGDIRQWVREAVREEVQNLIKQHDGQFSIDAIARREVSSMLNDKFGGKHKLRDATAKELATQLVVSVKEAT